MTRKLAHQLSTVLGFDLTARIARKDFIMSRWAPNAKEYRDVGDGNKHAEKAEPALVRVSAFPRSVQVNRGTQGRTNKLLKILTEDFLMRDLCGTAITLLSTSGLQTVQSTLTWLKSSA